MALNGVALVSLDVDSMYNNMSQDLGTSACKDYLESRIFQMDGDENLVSTNSILTALNLCLKNNYFYFNKKIYKQIKGVGTGIKLAPTYACLGMGKYEEMLFNSNEVMFVDFLNTLMPGVIKFKYEFSCQKIQFLDLEIFLEDGKLKTNMFVKPTNSQIYLDFHSNHPMHCKEGIP